MQGEPITRRQLLRAGIVGGGLLAMPALLDACSSSSTPATAKQTQPAGSLEAFLTSAAKPYHGKSINVLCISSTQADAIKALSPTFERLTGVTVNWTVQSEGNEQTKLLVDERAHSSAVDVIQIENFFVAQYQLEHWFTPVGTLRQDKTTTYPKLTLTPYSASAVAQLSSKGQLLAMPMFLATQVVYYRTDVFEKNGVTRIPTTLSELEALCGHINKKPLPAIALRSAAGPTENVFDWTAWLYNSGGLYYRSYDAATNKYSSPALSDPRSVAAAELYARVLQRYAPTGSLNWAVADVTRAFLAGDVAMMQEGSPFGGAVNDPKQSAVAGKVAAFPIPRGPAGSYYPAGAQGWAVNAYSKNHGPAWLFVQWATDPGTLLQACVTQPFSSPPVPSIFSAPAFVKKYSYKGFLPSVEQALAAKKSSPIGGSYLPNLTNWEAAGQKVSTLLNEVITGSKSASAAMGAADSVLAEYA
jgi:multiple sugar transport system substrate-binding protein